MSNFGEKIKYRIELGGRTYAHVEARNVQDAFWTFCEQRKNPAQYESGWRLNMYNAGPQMGLLWGMYVRDISTGHQIMYIFAEDEEESADD